MHDNYFLLCPAILTKEVGYREVGFVDTQQETKVFWNV